MVTSEALLAPRILGLRLAPVFKTSPGSGARQMFDTTNIQRRVCIRRRDPPPVRAQTYDRIVGVDSTGSF